MWAPPPCLRRSEGPRPASGHRSGPCGPCGRNALRVACHAENPTTAPGRATRGGPPLRHTNAPSGARRRRDERESPGLNARTCGECGPPDGPKPGPPKPVRPNRRAVGLWPRTPKHKTPTSVHGGRRKWRSLEVLAARTSEGGTPAPSKTPPRMPVDPSCCRPQPPVGRPPVTQALKPQPPTLKVDASTRSEGGTGGRKGQVRAPGGPSARGSTRQAGCPHLPDRPTDTRTVRWNPQAHDTCLCMRCGVYMQTHILPQAAGARAPCPARTPHRVPPPTVAPDVYTFSPTACVTGPKAGPGPAKPVPSQGKRGRPPCNGQSHPNPLPGASLG